MSLDSFFRTTLIKVNGVPNTNPNHVKCEEGLVVEYSIPKEPLLLKFSKGFLSVGFQHRYFIRKPFIWNRVKELIFKFTHYQDLPLENKVSAKEIEEPETINVDVVVVGGGLAGLAAAIETSKRGLSTVVIDDNTYLGGRSRFDNSIPFGFDKPMREVVDQLYDEAKENGVKFLPETILNGFWEDGVIAYHLKEPAGGKLYYINANIYIIATGSLELPVIYENNDLPGSITSTTALQLVNEYNINLGDKAVLLGLTDFSARVALQLAEKGIDIIILLKGPELSNILDNTKRKLEESKIKIISGVKNIKAVGKERIEKIIVVDKEGKKEIKTNYVLFGSMENSNFKLPAIAGAEVRYFEKLGFIPVHNELLETKANNVLVAGGVTGTPYEALRILEGKIAGLTASIKLNKGNESERKELLTKYKETLSKLKLDEPKRKVYNYYEKGEVERIEIRDIPTQFTDTISKNQFICFCEDITLKDLHKIAKEVKFEKMQLIKRYSGIATGFCQGRLCLVNATLMTSKILNKDPNYVGIITQRPPVIPMPFRLLVGGEK